MTCLTPALKKRIQTTYSNQKQRARKHGDTLSYTCAELGELVRCSLNSVCPYCEHLSSDWTVDHSMPTSRGGTHTLANLTICCRGCNESKGNMSREEFTSLLTLAKTFHPAARSSLLARLRAGGRLIYGRR